MSVCLCVGEIVSVVGVGFVECLVSAYFLTFWPENRVLQVCVLCFWLCVCTVCMGVRSVSGLSHSLRPLAMAVSLCPGPKGAKKVREGPLLLSAVLDEEREIFGWGGGKKGVVGGHARRGTKSDHTFPPPLPPHLYGQGP